MHAFLTLGSILFLLIMTQSAAPRTYSTCITEGIRVEAYPSFIAPGEARKDGQNYFSYRICIINDGQETVQLLSREWLIINAEGSEQHVAGEGVVGYTPILEAGQSFEYTSYCPIDTPWGTMEGYYIFKRQDQTFFKVRIERFYLVVPELMTEDKV